ncbi:MutS-related protein [Ancylomarina sp.]|uniref:MutS-related protein n=1 Tax=Ancylomarina sp. TaxID=1970196 RepID=UPI003563199D
MIFKRKKKEIERLKASFGKEKDDAFKFKLISKYFKNKDNSNSFHVLSDKTCNDLDFEELFMFVDRTSSKVGQQYLYQTLRCMPSDSKATDLNESLIKNLSEDVDFRVKTQMLLEKLKKEDVYYLPSIFQEEHLEPPKWFFAIRLLSFTSLLSILLLPFRPELFLLLIPVFIVNLGIHYWNKRNLYQYVGSIPQLLRLNSIAVQLHKEDRFKEINPDLNAAIQVIDQVRSRMSFFQLEEKIQGDFEVAFWAVLEILKTTFLLEPLLLFGVLKRLNTKRKEIEEVFSFVGQIDVLISIASIRHGLDSYCIPVINDNEVEISSTDVYHPLIDGCVTNSIAVKDKSVLLTGSNMSGKTSFIRTMGLNLITGLTLNTCFAKSMSMPRARIYSAIRISDDLMNDKSYYFEEVLTIKEMIDHSESLTPNLFLLDEIFKGTNTVERISAGKAVLSSLSKNKNIVLVSTHDIELTDMLGDEYELYHFSEIVTDSQIDFDYKLKEGRLKNRNAIRILQINNYPDEVINEAIELSNQLDEIAESNKVRQSLRLASEIV